MNGITPETTPGVMSSHWHFGSGAAGSLSPTGQLGSIGGLELNPGSVDSSAGIDSGLETQVQQSYSSFVKQSLASRKGKRLSTTGSNQRLIGTPGNDILEAFRGGGQNQLKGKSGNDKLLAGKNDRLFGDAGNDILDARKGKGKNQLFGGAGKDTLYAKSGDRLDGGTDNDILWAGLGGNQLKGGSGADQFWIADRTFPKTANTIQDFQLGTDTIGVNTVSGVTRFSDLTLTQQGGNTLISAQGKAIAVLSNVAASALSAQNFVGLQPALPTLSTNNVSVSERDTGKTGVAVNVSLSAASTTPVTVNYRSVPGTATAEDADFAAVNGTLTFAAGETTKAIAIEIINDTKDEFDETFSIVLSNPTNATLAASQSQITIIDNDTTTIEASGTKSDGSKTSSIDARYTFDLYDITPTGDYRLDEEGNPNKNVGIFRNAIENFSGYIRENGVDPFLKFNLLQIGNKIPSFPSSDPDLVVPTASPSPLTLDLKATFIPRGSTVTFLDGTSDVATANRLEYTFTSNELRDGAGIFEWTLILSDALIEESVIDTVKAVNSIEYIIANQLLAKAEFIRLSATSKADPQKLFVENDNIETPFNNSTGASPPRVITRPTPVAIPRPATYSATLAPTNDTILNASDTGLSANGFRRFNLSTQIGDDPASGSASSTSKDVDFYKVQLNAGDLISVNTDGFSLDSIVRLFNANGVQLAFSDNDLAPEETFAGGGSYLEFRANTAGTYYIGVSGSNNSAYNPFISNSGIAGDADTYQLEILVLEPNNTIAKATDTELYRTPGFYRISTRIGDSIEASSGADVDFYKVQLNAGNLLTIDIDTGSFPAGADKVDSFLRLFNANGTQLRSSDDNTAPGEIFSAGFSDSYIEFTAATTGTYYIGVSGYNNSSYDPLTGAGGTIGDPGFYTLEISRTV